VDAAGVALIVGLGNPGPGHEGDRHNAGFWFIDALCDAQGIELREETRFKGLLGRASSGLRVLKPLTFMNASGESVAACAAYFRIPPAAVVVVRSIDRLLGSADYLRIRLGIGHPGSAAAVTGYVLGRPPAAERDAIGQAISSTLDELANIVDGRFDRAMNTLNQR
jgi:PTH1 family peptidyl-tRNA hydrolase